MASLCRTCCRLRSAPASFCTRAPKGAFVAARRFFSQAHLTLSSTRLVTSWPLPQISSFQKIGGRFKLEADDGFRSCFGAVAAAAALRSSEEASRRQISPLGKIGGLQVRRLGLLKEARLQQLPRRSGPETYRRGMPLGFDAPTRCTKQFRRRTGAWFNSCSSLGLTRLAGTAKGRDLESLWAEIRAPDWIRAAVVFLIPTQALGKASEIILHESTNREAGHIDRAMEKLEPQLLERFG